MAAPGDADAAQCREGPQSDTERPAGFREEHGVKVFPGDAATVT